MRPLLVPVLVALALLPVAQAEDCEPTTSESDERQTVVTLPDACSSLVCYVVVDHDPAGCFGAVWVYPEVNGRPGLQRGDECRDDTCGGQIEADVILP